VCGDEKITPYVTVLFANWLLLQQWFRPPLDMLYLLTT